MSEQPKSTAETIEWLQSKIELYERSVARLRNELKFAEGQLRYHRNWLAELQEAGDDRANG